ncbi:FAD:protein FMN transferase [Tumebacillus flagellatus]|uniref:FAD:protein FMN transferase n=1 Tax=Tumebacillus flagellatus TaxID=1157490 RepID=A0A074LXM7_9BACL|nr:FAD:protein FMN transferase [Tumebacillus flagellatus]KEO84873.1 hypothetical protein EL26_02360 [Tumebacillus flagellatus]
MTNGLQRRTKTRSALHMDTLVSIQVVSHESPEVLQHQLDLAFAAFSAVERVCSRFDPDSELRRLCEIVGEPVPVSGLLFEAVRFAWEVADMTHGVFDPTIGHRMEHAGFTRNYLTGEKTAPQALEPATYRDLLLNEENRTILLKKPLRLDLGAVAKGLAIDLAAQGLRRAGGFLINAGGDVYAGGRNEHGELWRVGIQHPAHPDEIITSLTLTDSAVCTSGSYERVAVSTDQTLTHHLLDPRTGTSAQDLLSCTVTASYAMMADAFSTAAFLLGPTDGQALLDEAGLSGLFITPDLTILGGREASK